MSHVKISTMDYNFFKNTYKKKKFGYFAMGSIVLAAFSQGCYAEANFNPAFLEHVDGDVADLSAFASDNGGQQPGRYLVDIIVNDAKVDHRYVEFIATPQNGTDIDKEKSVGLTPCFTQEELESYGVKFPKKADEQASNDESDAAEGKPKEAATKAECSLTLLTVKDATSEFDFGQQRLLITIPQALMSQNARGYVDPKNWDDGITALLLDYDFSGANEKQKDHGSSFSSSSSDSSDSGSESNSSDNSYYLNLRSGFNLGPWRYRNNSALNKSNGERKWQSINNYVQRSIVFLKSQLVMGDSFSTSDIFDGQQFRGVQIASDDEMLPDSLQGFAPIVRGIAKTNAQVTISQNGYVIYQSYVSPGAFEISDLYPSGNSGDLTVEVKESDGSLQTFVQPYASVPVLQREGRTKYSVTAGEYRDGYGGSTPTFGQFTLIHGFAKGLTMYTGMQGSKNYAALALGVGSNLGEIGAVSLDVTQAKTDLPDGVTEKGQSYRFLFAKSFVNSGTDFRLLGYRYSTSGFYTLQESVDLNDEDNSLAKFDIGTHKRSKIEGSINQSLPEEMGSFYFSASVQDYWGDDSKEQTLQWGYSNVWNGIAYNLAFNNSYISGQDSDKQFTLSVSLPLDRWLKGSWATYNMTHDSNGQVTQQAGISGTLLNDNNLNYSVSQSQGNKGQGGSGNTNIMYQGRYGNANVGYSYNKYSNRLNYGLKGGAVVHSGGITLSQPLGETVALVAAPGSGDTRIKNTNGIHTDEEGYAVLTYISPYRRNTVSLDTTSLRQNVELDESAKDVVPTRGAVVKASFVTHIGYRVMMQIKQNNGKFLPFGTSVSLQNNDGGISAGLVGEAGEAYLSGLPAKGTLLAQWGKGVGESCTVNYQIPESQAEIDIISLKEICEVH